MICLVLTARSIEENILLVERNREYIDLVELRVDLLSESEREKSVEFPSQIPFPTILTIRRTKDGGAFSGSEKSRLTLLERVLEAPFAYVDIESDVKRLSIEQKAKERNIGVIRSLHDFNGIPTDIFHQIAKLASGGAIPKVAVTPNSVGDLITLFKIKEELSSIEKKIVVGMGDYGFPSRILYKRVGSMLTYCSENSIAPGQITAQLMKELYRADQVDEKSSIFGVIGNPVLHSLSPHIHNRGFHKIKFNAIYLPFVVDSVRSFFALAEMLQIRGFSVTVPHKQSVLPYLGDISREVKQIGSCNTVKRTKNLYSGMNTDYYGFLFPLLPHIETKKIQNALVIGAGGAARAVVWALRNHGVKVTILNRSVERAQLLASETMSSYDSLERAPEYASVDLIVQTTSVGMGNGSFDDPIPTFPFNSKQWVYELIYRPQKTPLIKRALEADATIIYGLEMLLRQGMLQFEAFTGYHYPKRLEQKLRLEEY